MTPRTQKGSDFSGPAAVRAEARRRLDKQLRTVRIATVREWNADVRAGKRAGPVLVPGSSLIPLTFARLARERLVLMFRCTRCERRCRVVYQPAPDAQLVCSRCARVPRILRELTHTVGLERSLLALMASKSRLYRHGGSR